MKAIYKYGLSQADQALKWTVNNFMRSDNLIKYTVTDKVFSFLQNPPEILFNIELIFFK